MRVISGKKLQCSCWCVNRDAEEKNKESGLEIHDTQDRWEDYAFDLTQIISIKQSGTNDFIKEGEASTITFKNGDSVTIDVSFSELWKVWQSV